MNPPSAVRLAEVLRQAVAVGDDLLCATKRPRGGLADLPRRVRAAASAARGVGLVLLCCWACTNEKVDLLPAATAAGGSPPSADDDAPLAGSAGCEGGGCASGGMVGFPRCNEDSDCAGGGFEGLFCDEERGDCVQCTADAHCSAAGDASGHCNAATGACVECTSDAHCADRGDGFTQCDPRAGRCVECMWDDHCGDNPYGARACISEFRKCFECAQNEDCADPRRPLCVTYDAWLHCNEPSFEDPATDAGAPFNSSEPLPPCVLVGSCVECLSGDDCAASPGGPYCDQRGGCVQCKTSDDCALADGSDGMLCDSAWGRCVECLDNVDCRSDQYCDHRARECRDPLPRCFDERDCAPDERCIDSMCVPT